MATTTALEQWMPQPQHAQSSQSPTADGWYGCRARSRLCGFGNAGNLATINTYCTRHSGAVNIHAIDGKHSAIDGHNECHHRRQVA
mgnify:CR=1 FL=1